MRRALLSKLLTGVSLAAASQLPAMAQETDGVGAVEESRRLDTVTVNATRRETGIQEVPIAVTALSAEALDQAGVQDITDLPALSASFNTNSSNSQATGTTFRIRGVGTTGNNAGLESAVGVFLDGVFLSRPGIALSDLVDLEQVEVLRGPQGTLFGRNTSAGAINIRTAKPNLEEVEGFGNLTVGNFSAVNVQGGVSVPLVQDRLGLRVSGAFSDRNGFLDSTNPDNPEGSFTRNRWLVRAQLYAEPTDNVTARLIFDYADSDDLCCDAVHLSSSGVLPLFPLAGLPADGGAPVTGFEESFQGLVGNGGRFEDPTEQLGVSFELNWDFGLANLTYIGAYRDFESGPNVQENDFLLIDAFSALGSTATPDTIDRPNGQDIESITQELRLQGTAFGDRLDWLVGAYYSDEDIVVDATLIQGADFQAFAGVPLLAVPGVFQTLGGVPLLSLTASPLNPTGVSAAGNFAQNQFTQNGESYSFFTHNVLDITSRLNLTLGLRYVNETKDGSFDQIEAFAPACSALIGNIVGGVVPPAFAGGAFALSCFPQTATADLPTSVLLPTPRTFAETFEDDELVYTVKLGYEIVDGINTYFSFTHGFKSGGINLDPSAAAVSNSAAVLAGVATGMPVAPIFGDPTFDSEEIDAFEIGIKADVLDNRLRLNLAGFYQNIDDFQVLEFTGTQFTTFNVPQAKSIGVELEGQFIATRNLVLNSSVTYTDAEYPDDCDDGVFSPVISPLCGNSLTNAPEWVVLFGGQYERDLTASGFRGFFGLNGRFESDRRTSTQAVLPDGSPLPFDIQDANTKLDLRAGISSPDDRWALEIWGRNVTDQITRNTTFNLPLNGGARGAFIDDPATYGATLRFKY
ncbi:MAG: TonB-dependent receptor [Pseudomonadota bacterium]